MLKRASSMTWNWPALRRRTTARRIEMQTGQSHCATMPAGTCIRCRDGIAWLTAAGDFRDHLLRSGETFQVPQRCKIRIEAIEPCRLEFNSRPGN